MIDESEISGPDPIQGGVERDLLAQRRARRSEMSDPGLIQRAEAAEATVRTLETHLNSIQQRLQDTAGEQRRMSEQLAEREREVRRVKQREYAEQQLRVEVEERCERVNREKQAEVDELHRRLNISERHAQELADQLEVLRHELSAAQQTAAAERRAASEGGAELSEREAELEQRELQLEQAKAQIEQHLSAARNFEQRARDLREQAQERQDILTSRLTELEQRAAEVQQEVETQKIARERSELTLSRVQESRSGLKAIVRELEQAARQLRGAIEQERAALQREFDRKREEVGAEYAANFERERENLNSAHAVELERAQQHSEQQVTELAAQRERLSKEHAAQLEQIQSLGAQLEQQRMQLERQREQLSSEHSVQLERMRERVRELEQELERTAEDLRRRELAQSQQLQTSPPAGHPDTDSADAARRREMTEALAAAVERLRARVASVSEQHDQPDDPPAPEQPAAPASAVVEIAPEPSPILPAHEPAPPAQAEDQAQPPVTEEGDFKLRVLPSVKRASSWLAPAIRSVAERGEAKLAGELIVELLPAQRLVFTEPCTYAIEIDEVGSFRVRLDGEQTVVEKVNAPSTDEKIDFLLKGQAAAFSEFAAGGGGRRMPGLKVRGSKRRARKLLSARKPPIALADIADTGMSIWPGLLLLAIAAAIDPDWTKGQKYTISFEILGEPSSVTIFVCVNDGAQVLVSRTHEGEVAASAKLSERALTCLFAARPLPADETIAVEGQASSLEALLSLSDRAQGLDAQA